jgi:hypothetical protein
VRTTRAILAPACFALCLHGCGENRQNEEFLARYAPAKARFDELCKSAGARILDSAENVDGILLMKIRAPSAPSDWKDPTWAGAALSPVESGDAYVLSFLLDEDMPNHPGDVRGRLTHRIGTGLRGYRYVDYFSPVDGTRYRYTAVPEQSSGVNRLIPKMILRRTATDAPSPRYAVTYEDNVDPVLRRMWIAGTTLRVIDTYKNRVMAEKLYWRFDTGLGNADKRSPWGLANACDSTFTPDTAAQTRQFVDQVVKPKQGD